MAEAAKASSSPARRAAWAGRSCERLARGGWRVLAVDCNADNLAWTEGVANVSSLVADVSSEADNARIAAEAERLFGGLDAAIFNAGITGGGSIDDHADGRRAPSLRDQHDRPGAGHPRAAAAAQEARERRRSW